MKLLRASPDRFVFHLGKREQRLLFDTLQLYPLVPPAHHRLAGSGQMADDGEAQRMLDEALADQRRENREQLLALLKDPKHFRETKRGLELTLAPAQMEWLLQVLNDVRVGSWLALGEPEEGSMPVFDEKAGVFWVAMEVCGIYQSVILAALGTEQSPNWQ
jgi:hypothetical protein